MKTKIYRPRGLCAVMQSAIGAEYQIGRHHGQPRGGCPTVRIIGPLEHHCGYGDDSYDDILTRAKEAVDASVNGYAVIEFDTPGGVVSGCFETARSIRKYADSKNVQLIGVVNDLAASAGYALASVCHYIYATTSSSVGSIGVIDVMVDATAADAAQGLKWSIITSGPQKSYGNPHVPVTESALVAAQEHVDDLAMQFYELVSEYRNISVDDIISLGAAIVPAKKASTIGLIDGIIRMSDLGDVISNITNQVRSSIMEKKEDKMSAVVAALKAIAEEDKDEMAIKMLAAMGAPEEDKEDEKPSEKAAKAEAPEDEKDDEEDKPDKPEAKAMNNSIAKLVREETARAFAEAESHRLLAGVPGLSASAKASLVQAGPKAIAEFITNSKPSPVKDAMAAVGVTSTLRGEDNTYTYNPSNASEDDDMDRAMGLYKPTKSVTHEANASVFRAGSRK